MIYCNFIVSLLHLSSVFDVFLMTNSIIMEKNVKKRVGRQVSDDPRVPVPLRLRRSWKKNLKALADADRRSLSILIEMALEKVYGNKLSHK